MKVFTHNFNPQSDTGPNKFSRTLLSRLISEKKITITNDTSEADVEFCVIQQQTHKVKPMVLRLDGIYFNSIQDFNQQNTPIKFAYDNADAVIFQSNFNKKLTESWFGPHKNGHVIHNAADPQIINHPDILQFSKKIDWPWPEDKEVWSCAASWRPHKRLKDNIDYFLKHAPSNAVFAIAGELGDDKPEYYTGLDARIHYLGKLNYPQLICLYHRSTTFVHLAYLDHCPNVVVDAQAAGCKIICSSTGGTHEVVDDGIMILEAEWDFKPCELYNPPQMEFNKTKEIVIHRDFKDRKTNKKVTRFAQCVNAYYNVMEDLL
jgi:glycosyltransferase involved in cell wall biosynthesis|tara:strand:+ start:1680 stop:2636 length:957 start_codon:yes stop_codon:yes gene_type:complete